MGDLKTIPLAEIRENPVALRNVNRKSEDYKGLCESIRSKGFLGTITVREKVDPETNVSYYEVLDGLHRFSASKDVGLTEINVDVVEMGDDDAMLFQIMANEHRIDTKPVEYSQQLRRYLAGNPTMTEAQLATELGKSTKWLQDRLGLNKIENPEIQKLINEGAIKLANAYPLAKLPAEEMTDFLEAAMQDKPDEFLPKINKRVKELKDAKRQGKKAEKAVFEPVAHIRKTGDIKAEFESHAAAAALCAQHEPTTPVDGFNLGIAWVLNMDPAGIEAQREKHEQRQADRAAAKEKKDRERAAKRAEDYAKKAEEARAEAAALAVAAAEAQS